MGLAWKAIVGRYAHSSLLFQSLLRTPFLSLSFNLEFLRVLPLVPCREGHVKALTCTQPEHFGTAGGLLLFSQYAQVAFEWRRKCHVAQSLEELSLQNSVVE